MGNFFRPENTEELNYELSQLVKELREGRRHCSTLTHKGFPEAQARKSTGLWEGQEGQPNIPITINQTTLSEKLASSTFVNALLYSWWSLWKLVIPLPHPNPDLKRRQHLRVGDLCLLYYSTPCRMDEDDNWWLCVVVNTSITNDIIPTVQVGFIARRHWVHGIHYNNRVKFYEMEVASERLVLLVPNKEASEDASDNKHQDNQLAD